ncbi:MAG TPA: AraC family transcriptional regulator, partial [bacterium]
SKTLPDTVASPLEDYGMLFFFSPEPGRNETQAKLEVLDKIDLISKFAANRLKVKILAGISRCVGAGDDISRVFWEAVTALGFCGPLNRPILFYEDVRKNPTVPVPANFYQMAKRLIEVYTNGVVGEIETVRNEYVVQILAHSAGRPENVRLHFFYVFGQIVDILRKRSPAENQNFLFIFKKLEGELQEMGTIADLITVFRESLKRLIAMTLKPLEASQSIRLEGVRKYIDENFSQNLKLEKVARDNGFSVSVFGRGFKKVMGMSISAYLRKVRLEHAKKLLSSTRLPITQVSQECGFNNLQYFFDVFKRSTGKTPQEFRDSKGRPLSIDT